MLSGFSLTGVAFFSGYVFFNSRLHPRESLLYVMGLYKVLDFLCGVSYASCFVLIISFLREICVAVFFFPRCVGSEAQLVRQLV